jgi:hypothetical protein
MAGSDDDLVKSRRSDAEDQGWSSTDRVLDGQTIGRSSDAVCGLYRAQGDEERGVLSLASKLRSTVFQFVPQNWHLRFGDFGLKITTTVS